MARHEADREDLLAEATALVVRGEWRVPAHDEPVTAGVRRDGAVSVYLGGDPCYHFDSAGRLKRAFVDGHLYRSEGSSLARFSRSRTATSSELLREELSPADVVAFLDRMQREVLPVIDAVPSGQAELLRSVIPEGRSLDEIAARLQQAAERRELSPALVRRAR